MADSDNIVGEATLVVQALIDDLKFQEEALRIVEQVEKSPEFQRLKLKLGIETEGTEAAAKDVKEIKRHVDEVGDSWEKAALKAAAFTFAIHEVKKSVGEVINKFSELNDHLVKAKSGFTGLLGSQKEGLALFEKVEEFGTNTSYSVEGLTRATEQLLAVGVAGNRIMPILTNVGEVIESIGGDPEDMNRILFSLTQIQTVGHLTGQSALQLQRQLIPITKYIADYTHKSVEDVQKLQAAGGISSDIVFKALEAQGKKVEGALAGSIDNITDARNVLKKTLDKAITDSPAFQEIYDDILNGVKKLTEGLKDPQVQAAIDKFFKGIQKMYGELKPLFKGIAEFGSGAGMSSLKILTQVLGLLGDTLEKFPPGVLELIGTGLGVLAAIKAPAAIAGYVGEIKKVGVGLFGGAKGEQQGASSEAAITAATAATTRKTAALVEETAATAAATAAEQSRTLATQSGTLASEQAAVANIGVSESLGRTAQQNQLLAETIAATAASVAAEAAVVKTEATASLSLYNAEAGLTAEQNQLLGASFRNATIAAQQVANAAYMGYSALNAYNVGAKITAQQNYVLKSSYDALVTSQVRSATLRAKALAAATTVGPIAAITIGSEIQSGADPTNKAAQTAGGALKYAGIGALVGGQVGGVPGAAIGAAIGLAYGAISSFLDAEEAQWDERIERAREAGERIAKAYLTAHEKAFASVTVTSNQLILTDLAEMEAALARLQGLSDFGGGVASDLGRRAHGEEIAELEESLKQQEELKARYVDPINKAAQAAVDAGVGEGLTRPQTQAELLANAGIIQAQIKDLEGLDTAFRAYGVTSLDVVNMGSEAFTDLVALIDGLDTAQKKATVSGNQFAAQLKLTVAESESIYGAQIANANAHAAALGAIENAKTTAGAAAINKDPLQQDLLNTQARSALLTAQAKARAEADAASRIATDEKIKQLKGLNTAEGNRQAAALETIKLDKAAAAGARAAADIVVAANKAESDALKANEIQIAANMLALRKRADAAVIDAKKLKLASLGATDQAVQDVVGLGAHPSDQARLQADISIDNAVQAETARLVAAATRETVQARDELLAQGTPLNDKEVEKLNAIIVQQTAYAELNNEARVRADIERRSHYARMQFIKEEARAKALIPLQLQAGAEGTHETAVEATINASINPFSAANALEAATATNAAITAAQDEAANKATVSIRRRIDAANEAGFTEDSWYRKLLQASFNREDALAREGVAETELARIREDAANASHAAYRRALEDSNLLALRTKVAASSAHDTAVDAIRASNQQPADEGLRLAAGDATLAATRAVEAEATFRATQKQRDELAQIGRILLTDITPAEREQFVLRGKNLNIEIDTVTALGDEAAAQRELNRLNQDALSVKMHSFDVSQQAWLAAYNQTQATGDLLGSLFVAGDDYTVKLTDDVNQIVDVAAKLLSASVAAGQAVKDAGGTDLSANKAAADSLVVSFNLLQDATGQSDEEFMSFLETVGLADDYAAAMQTSGQVIEGTLAEVAASLNITTDEFQRLINKQKEIDPNVHIVITADTGEAIKHIEELILALAKIKLPTSADALNLSPDDVKSLSEIAAGIKSGKYLGTIYNPTLNPNYNFAGDSPVKIGYGVSDDDKPDARKPPKDGSADKAAKEAERWAKAVEDVTEDLRKKLEEAAKAIEEAAKTWLGSIKERTQYDPAVSINRLIKNATKQADDAAELLAGITDLKARGVSQSVLDNLQVDNIADLKQVRKLQKASAPQIAELNAEVAAGLKTGQILSQGAEDERTRNNIRDGILAAAEKLEVDFSKEQATEISNTFTVTPGMDFETVVKMIMDTLTAGHIG